MYHCNFTTIKTIIYVRILNSKNNLIRHHQAVHLGRKYPCEECDYKAAHKSSLTTHQNSVHMGKKYP